MVVSGKATEVIFGNISRCDCIQTKIVKCFKPLSINDEKRFRREIRKITK